MMPEVPLEDQRDIPGACSDGVRATGPTALSRSATARGEGRYRSALSPLMRNLYIRPQSLSSDGV
jgi:hypothetical protein